MKIYAILYDNDEPYEDNHKWVDEYESESAKILELKLEEWAGEESE